MNMGHRTASVFLLALAVLTGCGGDADEGAQPEDSSGLAVEAGAEVLADIDVRGEARVQFVAAGQDEDIIAVASLSPSASEATLQRLRQADLGNLPRAYAQLADATDPATVQRLVRAQETVQRLKDGGLARPLAENRFTVGLWPADPNFRAVWYDGADKKGALSQALDAYEVELFKNEGAFVVAQRVPSRGSFEMRLLNGSQVVVRRTVPEGSLGEFVRVSGSGARKVSVASPTVLIASWR